jgi:hypothetical protein
MVGRIKADVAKVLMANVPGLVVILVYANTTHGRPRTILN